MDLIKFSAVNIDSCHKIININSPFILFLRKGESLVDTIIKCAEIINFPSASLMGIGALENPTLANYNFKTKEHESKTLSGIYELTSLLGNITKLDNKYVTHIHVTLTDTTDTNFHSIGSHLVNALVGIIAEITVIPFANPIFREADPKLHLNIIKT